MENKERLIVELINASENKQLAVTEINNTGEFYTAAGILDKLGSGFNDEMYLVGGCIRDLLLGLEPHDYDITTSLVPATIIEKARIYNIKGISLIGVEYGTVVLSEYGHSYEVTTFRNDCGYSDGRHPDKVKYSNNLKDDLVRRDFTINAMAGKLFDRERIKDTNDIHVILKVMDYYNGMDDLRNGIIRCVGDPDKRFSEDALRILRAMRFAIRYEYKIEENTLKAMFNNKEKLKLVSKERVTEELRKMLTCGKPITPIFMKCADIVKEIIPELEVCMGFNQNNKYHQHEVYEHMLHVVDNCKTNKFEIKLAALLHDIGKPAAYFLGDDGYGHFHGHPKISFEICQELLPKRLRLTNEEQSLVLNLIREHDKIVIVDKKAIKRALNSMGEATFRDWMILRQADIDDHINLKNDSVNYIVDTSLYLKPLQEILDEKQPFSIKDLAIDGTNIMKLTNGKSGKHIGYILNKLLYDVIDEVIPNSTEELSNRAKELWEDYKNGGE